MNDFNLTALMEREGIRKVERFVNMWSVVLEDGRQASALTVGEALAKAKRPGAFNVEKAA
jgi:hypothetical protein